MLLISEKESIASKCTNIQHWTELHIVVRFKYQTAALWIFLHVMQKYDV